MKIKIHTAITDRRGQPLGPPTTLGAQIVGILDTTSVAAIQAAGNPRLLARVAERIDVGLFGDNKPANGEIEVNGEEEKSLKAAVMGATHIQFFYHRKIMGLLWPDTLEDDERESLLGKRTLTGGGQKPSGPNGGAEKAN